MTLIELREATKTYRGPPAVHSLKPTTLTINAGESVALVGRSGSGKSTLLNLLGGLDRPSSGRVALAGIDLTDLTDSELAGARAFTIGVVFQQFHLDPHLSALDNVADALTYRGVPRTRRREMARDALGIVDLGERLGHRPDELSGGECQRVAIARAIVGRPAVVLADEPTGNLDTGTGTTIMELIASLHTAGTTFVVATHDQTVANAMQRHIEISDGQIVSDDGAAPPR
jgi:putative ABC transport system ATP-binding protein